jgi:hypothetical protein
MTTKKAPTGARTTTAHRTGTHTSKRPTKPVASAPVATPVPTTKPAKNGKAEDKAARQVEEIMVKIIEGIVARRGADDVGDGDQWADQRRPDVDDYAYDLAVEVRKAREGGAAWWRIAHDLELPGNGPSAAQGKSGAAYARRLWERAWGKTYADGERAPRDTKERKRERAVTEEGRPYFAADAKETDIITRICGQMIHWVARLGDQHGGAIISPQETIVHHDPRTIKVLDGPKGRYVEFYEQQDPKMLKLDPARAIARTGPRRAVYLHSIEKVGR